MGATSTMPRRTCFIVRRDSDETFDVLSREFAPLDIPVIRDRRVSDRRRDVAPTGADRRQSDRRRLLLNQRSSWQATDFICVQIDAGSDPETPNGKS
jgi:hypothetical protein